MLVVEWVVWCVVDLYWVIGFCVVDIVVGCECLCECGGIGGGYVLVE